MQLNCLPALVKTVVEISNALAIIQCRVALEGTHFYQGSDKHGGFKTAEYFLLCVVGVLEECQRFLPPRLHPRSSRP